MYTSTIRTPADGTRFHHDCDHGFCTVCGMVWPCARARRGAPTTVAAIPTPRLPVL